VGRRQQGCCPFLENVFNTSGHIFLGFQSKYRPNKNQTAKNSEDYIRKYFKICDLYLIHIAIPVPGRGGPQGCEMLRIPHFLDNWLTDGGEVVSLMRQLPFTPQEDSWY
jgi:hypothetical protein